MGTVASIVTKTKMSTNPNVTTSPEVQATGMAKPLPDVNVNNKNSTSITNSLETVPMPLHSTRSSTSIAKNHLTKAPLKPRSGHPKTEIFRGYNDKSSGKSYTSDGASVG